MLMSVVVDLRQKAVEVVMAVTSGAYQTSLLTYFIQRDLFPSVMKVLVLHDPVLTLTASSQLRSSSSKTPTYQEGYWSPSRCSVF
jgi:hypothetical protein